MDKVGNYSIYQKSYYDNIVKDRDKKAKANKADKSKNEKQVQLSDAAKDLLKELRDKYKNMDFIVADYETDEEADSYLSRGTKEFSVLIDPEELEKMASDDKVKEKNLSLIEEAAGNLKGMKEKLGSKSKEVKNLGVSINKDGTLTYFASLEEMSAKQRERIEESRAKKKEEAAKADNPFMHRHKHTKVQSDTVEGLLEAIKNVDWDKVKEEEIPERGGRFDFSM